jgi:hypothetical protein
MKHVVKVWNIDSEVSVSQLSKSVWRATGTYHGEVIETKDRSEGAALKRWREAAQYRGNG